MNYRRLIVALALIAVRLVVPFASAEPKAHDTVFYKGKAAGLKIVFEFDQGSVRPAMSRSPDLPAGKQRSFICRVEMDRWERARYDLLP
jgi:hypothetical protein